MLTTLAFMGLLVANSFALVLVTGMSGLWRCSGEGRSCGSFLSDPAIDPHPTCCRCRGKRCTKEDRCSICESWSDRQWVLYSTKRKPKRKSSASSGNTPPVPKPSSSVGNVSGFVTPFAPCTLSVGQSLPTSSASSVLTPGQRMVLGETD